MFGFLTSQNGAAPGLAMAGPGASLRLEALDAIGTNVMVADAACKIVYMNPAVTRLLQAAEADIRKDFPDFDASSLVGKSIDVFHKNPMHQRRMLERLDGVHKATIRLGDLTFDLCLTPLADRRGQRTGFVVEWSDARHRIENAEYAAQTAAIQKSQAVVEMDMDGNVLTANSNFLTTMGYALEEVQGGHHRQFVPDGLKESAEYEAFWDALRRGEYQSGQFQRVAKDGRTVWIEATYNPIIDYKGKPYKVIKFATEITRQIEMLGQLKAMIDTNFAEVEQALHLAHEQGITAEQAAGDTMSNTQAVSAGAEELAQSARDISQSMVKSQAAAESAYVEAASADAAAQRLSQVAKSMGGIVDLIRSIAGQINLLALNATIEAARAGEAGRGFAVVATEVKNLANQSADATTQITREIEGIQGVAADVAQSLGAIRQAMDGVREFVTITAGAVEEQSAVTASISHTIQGTFQAVDRVGAGIGNISAAVAEVADAVARTKDAASILAR